MEVQQHSYSIAFEVETALERHGYDNYDYVTKIKGEATGELSDGLTERPARVGGIYGYRVHLSEAVAEDMPVSDVFDAYSSLEMFYPVLIDDEEAGFREEALSNPDYEPWLMDILVIVHVEVVKYYRGRGLGHVLVERFIELFSSGCLFVALDIRPAREHANMEEAYRQAMGLIHFEHDDEVAQEKLIRYWRDAHFHHIAGSKVMTRALL